MSGFVKPAPAEKRKPKGEIKYLLSLNEEQKAAKSLILENDIILLKGAAGSGKTLLACQVALDKLFKGEVDKIIITRPVVTAAEDIGYLPGGMKEKMDPWLAPIYANLYALYNKTKIDNLVEEGAIEILPLAFVRGRTFVKAVVIIDEAQNVSHTQTEMIIGRLGQDSKMIFCGDTAQIDLKNKKEAGIDFFKTIEGRVDGVKIIKLEKNHRHAIVPKILDVYAEYNR